MRVRRTGRGGCTCGRLQLARFVLVLRIVVEVVAGLQILAFVIGLAVLVSLFVVGLVFGLAFNGTGLLSETFPVSGINLVCESLHGFEGGGFPLLSHNVLDSFRKTGIIAVCRRTASFQFVRTESQLNSMLYLIKC